MTQLLVNHAISEICLQCQDSFPKFQGETTNLDMRFAGAGCIFQ